MAPCERWYSARGDNTIDVEIGNSPMASTKGEYPLTRPAPADESAVAGHPLPLGGEGRLLNSMPGNEPFRTSYGFFAVLKMTGGSAHNDGGNVGWEYPKSKFRISNLTFEFRVSSFYFPVPIFHFPARARKSRVGVWPLPTSSLWSRAAPKPLRLCSSGRREEP